MQFRDSEEVRCVSIVQSRWESARRGAARGAENPPGLGGRNGQMDDITIITNYGL